MIFILKCFKNSNPEKIINFEISIFAIFYISWKVLFIMHINYLYFLPIIILEILFRIIYNKQYKELHAYKNIYQNSTKSQNIKINLLAENALLFVKRLNSNFKFKILYLNLLNMILSIANIYRNNTISFFLFYAVLSILFNNGIYIFAVSQLIYLVVYFYQILYLNKFYKMIKRILLLEILKSVVFSIFIIFAILNVPFFLIFYFFYILFKEINREIYVVEILLLFLTSLTYTISPIKLKLDTNNHLVNIANQLIYGIIIYILLNLFFSFFALHRNSFYKYIHYKYNNEKIITKINNINKNFPSLEKQIKNFLAKDQTSAWINRVFYSMHKKNFRLISFYKQAIKIKNKIYNQDQFLIPIFVFISFVVIYGIFKHLIDF